MNRRGNIFHNLIKTTMKREILFRGRALSNGQLIEGQVHTYGDGVFIAATWMMSNDGRDWRVPAIEVDPDTVGQFTGITCKNKDGKDQKVFEGDYVEFVGGPSPVIPAGYGQKPYLPGQIFIVKWLPSGFSLSIPEIIKSEIPNQIGHVDNYTFWNNHRGFKVIGNIHDNPGLLNDKT